MRKVKRKISRQAPHHTGGKTICLRLLEEFSALQNYLRFFFFL